MLSEGCLEALRKLGTDRRGPGSRETDRGGPTGVTSESGGFLPVAFPKCPDTTEIGKQTVGI